MNLGFRCGPLSAQQEVSAKARKVSLYTSWGACLAAPFAMKLLGHCLWLHLLGLALWERYRRVPVWIFQHKRTSMGCWWWWFGVLMVWIFQNKRKSMGCWWWWWFGMLVVWIFQHKRKSMGCCWWWFDVLVVWIFQHKRVYLG